MTEPRYRKATTAEALEVLLSRHGDKFSPAERDELREAIERLQRLDVRTVPHYCEGMAEYQGEQTVPVELESVELLRASFPIDCDGYKPVSFQHIHATLKYIDSLQSDLKRVTEERDKWEGLWREVGAALVKSHEAEFNANERAEKAEAELKRAQNSDEHNFNRWQKSQSINRRMVELLKEPSENADGIDIEEIADAVSKCATNGKAFGVIANYRKKLRERWSAELLNEVEK